MASETVHSKRVEVFGHCNIADLVGAHKIVGFLNRATAIQAGYGLVHSLTNQGGFRKKIPLVDLEDQVGFDHHSHKPVRFFDKQDLHPLSMKKKDSLRNSAFVTDAYHRRAY